MRFYHGQHRYYCGVDLHARSMYLCILDAHGAIVFHDNLRCDREAFLQAVAPFRDDLAVCAECIFCWYWLADLCAEHDIVFVLAHALYLKAIHGAKAKNDRVDAHKLAVLLRGGVIAQAHVYPPRMRPTRDLLRRRLFFARKRAELLTHIRNTFHQYNLPRPPAGRRIQAAHGPKLVARVPEAAVRRSLEADLQLCQFYDPLIRDLEKTIEHLAHHHAPQSLARLRTIPGIGRILGLTLLYEIETIERFPTVQDFSSYCRLVKPEKSSAGKRLGTSGARIGNAHLKWAFSEAAVCFLHANPRGQNYRKRLRRRHGKGKSLSILAAKLGRATYFMLKQQRPFDMDRFLRD